MAAPIIVVVDKADGTGATVTVSGTSGGTNTVLLALSDRYDLASAFAVTAFTRTGDGSIDIPLGDGLDASTGVNLTYAWMVKVSNSSSGLTSNPAVVTPTRGLLTPHFQAICAIQRLMINLNFPDILGKIYRCEWPGSFVAKIQRWPCVLLSPADAEDVGSQGSNLITLWKFPVSCSIADNDGSWFEQTETHLAMRWKMLGLFERRNPIAFENAQPGQIRRTTISPRSVVVPPSAEYQSFHSDFVITCECDRFANPGQTGN